MGQPHDILLRKLQEHSRLERPEIDALRRLSFRIRSFAPGDDIVRQGDRPTASALVIKGMVGRYHTRSDGGRQYISFHMTGELPDAQTLFLERMDHGVCAIGPADIAMIPHEEIVALFKRWPNVGVAIWRETLIDAAIFREAITNNSSRPVLTRMAHLFCEFYYRARAIGLTRPGSCDVPLHQGQIGDALGVSIVTANRALQDLRRTGTMDFRNGRLSILNWKKLAAIGEFDPNYLHFKRPPRM